MWLYGVIGFKEQNDTLINFKYIESSRDFFEEKIDKYSYYLHRGLLWFAKKRKDSVTNEKNNII
jgi:hypothetical protein